MIFRGCLWVWVTGSCKQPGTSITHSISHLCFALLSFTWTTLAWWRRLQVFNSWPLVKEATYLHTLQHSHHTKSQQRISSRPRKCPWSCKCPINIQNRLLSNTLGFVFVFWGAFHAWCSISWITIQSMLLCPSVDSWKGRRRRRISYNKQVACWNTKSVISKEFPSFAFDEGYFVIFNPSQNCLVDCSSIRSCWNMFICWHWLDHNNNK